MPAHREAERAMQVLDRLLSESGRAAAQPLDGSAIASIRAALAELAAENARLQEENALLREKESHFRDLFNATYDGIFLIDPESDRILDANAAALRLVGYTREDAQQGLRISDLHPYEMPRMHELAGEVQRHGMWQSHELTCRAKWGELIPVQLSATALVYDGRPCLLVLVQDLREHRLAKLGLAVSKIGHDLRNILATAQLLADGVAATGHPECMRIAPRITHSIDRAIALCTETLKHGRATQPPPRFASCKLRPLAEDVAATAYVIDAPNVTWLNHVPPGFELSADPDQLFRALLNLVRNAREALERTGGGEIRLEASRDGALVTIDVADTGPGIPPDVRERLFQPFANFGRPDSTGLGLVIARELMQGHGGDVTLHKSGPEGTVFRVELPAGAAGDSRDSKGSKKAEALLPQ